MRIDYRTIILLLLTIIASLFVSPAQRHRAFPRCRQAERLREEARRESDPGAQEERQERHRIRRRRDEEAPVNWLAAVR